MKKILIVVLIVVSIFQFSSCSSLPSGSNAEIDFLDTIEGKNEIKECCYEVVYKKPEADSLTYKDELPWDLVDINYRNDDYVSIGTAFAISDTKLVTASHVISLYEKSMVYTDRYIRETIIKEDGEKVENIYEIDKIISINNYKDYAVFTVKDKKFDKWLNFNKEPQFNSKVYTAGNAFGEGIVIRDGILQDKIPEEENGNWFYLKSSSLTNPGNSGGPLLNEFGEVVGIVILKKDDFCFSLPITEMSEDEYYYHDRLRYVFPLFIDNVRVDFDYNLRDENINYPINYKEYINIHEKKQNEIDVKGMEDLFEKYKDEIFPNGKSSEYALHDSNGSSFPQILLKNPDVDRWFFSNLQPQVKRLENNGVIRYQQIYKDSNYWIIDIDSPDTLGSFELYDNPKELMDYLCTGISFKRKLFNNDPGTRILSFGEPFSSEQIVDTYDRKWKASLWLQEYNDVAIIFVYTLTPKGVAGLYFACDSSSLQTNFYDMKLMLNFMDINYRAEVKEWVKYLEDKEKINPQFSNIDININNDFVKLKTTDYEIKFTKDVFNIQDDNIISLSFDFMKINEEFNYDIRKVIFSEKVTDNYFLSYRYLKPKESFNENLLNEWGKVVEHKHPFNSKVYFDDNGNQKVGTVHNKFVGEDSKVEGEQLYSIMIGREDAIEDELLLEDLQEMQNMFIFY